MVKFDFKKTPITQIADYIILAAAKMNASDIHFDPREDGTIVRIRVDGDLEDYTHIPKEYERNLATRLKLLANMNITEARLPQDGAIKGNFGGIDLDMRVSCLPLNEGEKIVVRILDYSRSLEGLDVLGFSKTNIAKLKRMIQVPNGIILITGATGSGKSTTVYSILQVLNKEQTNIITVEDPIEMNIEGLNQVQVNSEIGMTFAAALRSILRQDPNIIFIGEIRDSETAQIAVRASITGHLVLSTIHTNNALATVERLLDMNVERYLLSSALTGIISQRLAKKLCNKCKIERATTEYEKKLLATYLHKDIEKVYDVNPKGCNDCHNGYKGRTAIQEVLEFDDDIRNDLNNEKLKREDLKDLVYTDNVITMLQDALEKVVDGVTTFDEVYRIIEIDDNDTIFENTDNLNNSKNTDKTDKNKKAKKNKNKNIKIVIPSFSKDTGSKNVTASTISQSITTPISVISSPTSVGKNANSGAKISTQTQSQITTVPNTINTQTVTPQINTKVQQQTPTPQANTKNEQQIQTAQTVKMPQVNTEIKQQQIAAPQINTKVQQKTPTPQANTKVQQKTPTPQINTKVQQQTPTPQINTKVQQKTPTPQINTKNEQQTPTPQANTKNEQQTPTPQANTKNEQQIQTAQTVKMPQVNTEIKQQQITAPQTPTVAQQPVTKPATNQNIEKTTPNNTSKQDDKNKPASPEINIPILNK